MASLSCFRLLHDTVLHNEVRWVIRRPLGFFLKDSDRTAGRHSVTESWVLRYDKTGRQHNSIVASTASLAGAIKILSDSVSIHSVALSCQTRHHQTEPINPLWLGKDLNITETSRLLDSSCMIDSEHRFPWICIQRCTQKKKEDVGKSGIQSWEDWKWIKTRNRN